MAIFKEYTDTELKQFAIDLFDGKIFTDRHLPDGLAAHMVFMPLVFTEISQAEIEQVGLVFEYFSEAGPRSVNGCPIFFSMRFLNREQLDKLVGFYDKYKALKEEFQTT